MNGGGDARPVAQPSATEIWELVWFIMEVSVVCYLMNERAPSPVWPFIVRALELYGLYRVFVYLSALISWLTEDDDLEDDDLE